MLRSSLIWSTLMIDKKQLEFKASRECRWDDFLGCPVVKNLLSKVGEVGLIPGWGAKILHAWEIPWTEEPGGLQSIGSQRVRYD